MKLTGNTIFITGGASGIGHGLAEALHQRGNQVIIAGRRLAHLARVTQANPGMQALELDVTDPASIAAVSEQLARDFPALNVLINNAGVMELDDAATGIDDALLVTGVATNLLGPIRLTSALVAQLKRQPAATIINVTSGMGFVPFGMASVYSATKAALHSYTLTLRYQLTNSPVRVVELVPPWVQTDLLNSSQEPRAMPFAAFIAEVMQLLGTDAEELLVERVRPLRANPGENEGPLVTSFNDAMRAGQ